MKILLHSFQGCQGMISLSSWSAHRKTCDGNSSRSTVEMGKEVRALLSQSENGMIEIQTGGQVNLFSIPYPLGVLRIFEVDNEPKF